MSIIIQTQFAFDRNQNQKIETDEVVKFSDLAFLDENHNQSLEGAELEGIYYEYGKDTWLPADTPSTQEEQGIACTVKVKRIGLKDSGLDLDISCHPVPW